MSTTISDLKSAINGGLQRDKYLIEINTPGNSISAEKMNLMCKSVIFPERIINTVDYWHYGRRYSVRSNTEYAKSIDITFYDDSKMNLRKLFDYWMVMIDNSRKTEAALPFSGAENITDYKTDLVIWQVGPNNEKIYGMTIHDAFPTTLGQISYDADSVDSAVEFNVTFTFSEMSPISV